MRATMSGRHEPLTSMRLLRRKLTLHSSLPGPIPTGSGLARSRPSTRTIPSNGPAQRLYYAGRISWAPVGYRGCRSEGFDPRQAEGFRPDRGCPSGLDSTQRMPWSPVGYRSRRREDLDPSRSEGFRPDQGGPGHSGSTRRMPWAPTGYRSCQRTGFGPRRSEDFRLDRGWQSRSGSTRRSSQATAIEVDSEGQHAPREPRQRGRRRRLGLAAPRAGQSQASTAARRAGPRRWAL